MRLEISDLTPEEHSTVLAWCLEHQLSYEVRDEDKSWIAIHGVTREQRNELERMKIV